MSRDDVFPSHATFNIKKMDRKLTRQNFEGPDAPARFVDGRGWPTEAIDGSYDHGTTKIAALLNSDRLVERQRGKNALAKVWLHPGYILFCFRQVGNPFGGLTPVRKRELARCHTPEELHFAKLYARERKLYSHHKDGDVPVDWRVVESFARAEMSKAERATMVQIEAANEGSAELMMTDAEGNNMSVDKPRVMLRQFRDKTMNFCDYLASSARNQLVLPLGNRYTLMMKTICESKHIAPHCPWLVQKGAKKASTPKKSSKPAAPKRKKPEKSTSTPPPKESPKKKLKPKSKPTHKQQTIEQTANGKPKSMGKAKPKPKPTKAKPPSKPLKIKSADKVMKWYHDELGVVPHVVHPVFQMLNKLREGVANDGIDFMNFTNSTQPFYDKLMQLLRVEEEDVEEQMKILESAFGGTQEMINGLCMLLVLLRRRPTQTIHLGSRKNTEMMQKSVETGLKNTRIPSKKDHELISRLRYLTLLIDNETYNSLSGAAYDRSSKRYNPATKDEFSSDGWVKRNKATILRLFFILFPWPVTKTVEVAEGLDKYW